MKNIYPALTMLMLLSCQRPIDVKSVETSLWTWDGGFKVGEGDVISFAIPQQLFAMKGDTLYYRGNPRAIIVEVMDSGYRMKLTSLDRKEVGFYRNVDESLR